MLAPSKPDDEAKRLADLKALNILDTPADERFDRVTRIAHELFGVPIALVSLVDEHRQWFKSSVGLDVSETSREVSFCGHAILGDEVFVVSDAASDRRFDDNPLVLEAPNIRFYAGCPLKSTRGSKLGTLCVIDRKPREFDSRDKRVLQDLAAMVERELELTQMATVDELTEIPNRRGFRLLADNTLKLCHRQGLPATLVFLDLNRFKQINDEFGHAEGDRALRVFARGIDEVARESDIIARFGGDEFAILFANVTADTVDLIVSRFELGLRELCEQEGLAYEIVFSHGVVEYDPELHANIDALLDASDVEMYQHKKASRLARNSRSI